MSQQTPPFPDARRFTHEAMNTTFRLRISGTDTAVAQGMARECFDQLDFLETRLSRFIEGSDVARINRLQAGETLYISEACHQCLLASLDAHARTGGLFDISLGRRIDHRKSALGGSPPPLVGQLVIHPDIPAVTCQVPGREIDLGGIGKGYALDYLRQILVDWGADGGLLSAGASSILAFGQDAWPVDLTGNQDVLRISLTDAALSASGTGQQGSHILHPAGDEAMPATPASRVWVTAGTATFAEIWSTALMLVAPSEIASFISGEESIGSVHAEVNGKIATFKP